MSIVRVHRHRWIIDAGDRGSCWCGATRQFTNKLLGAGTFQRRPGRPPYRPATAMSDAEVRERLEATCGTMRRPAGE